MAKRYLDVSKSVGDKLRKIAKDLGNAKLEVGFVDGARYENGTSVAQVAFWNNFGHGGRFPSPPRNFFSAMIAAEQNTWAPKMAALAKHYNYNGPKVMAAMGDDIGGALRDAIVSTNSPVLSDTTLALRAKFGNDRASITISDVLAAQAAVKSGTATLAGGTQAHPLIWTGYMMSRISYSVNAGPAKLLKGAQ